MTATVGTPRRLRERARALLMGSFRLRRVHHHVTCRSVGQDHLLVGFGRVERPMAGFDTLLFAPSKFDVRLDFPESVAQRTVVDKFNSHPYSRYRKDSMLRVSHILAQQWFLSIEPRGV